MIRKPPILLAYPFRPFFLLTAVYAILVVVAWAGYMLGGWPLVLGASPLQWHSHEMLYGFVSAAIGGFLLTAIANWAGVPALQGKALAALLLVWLAGRLAMWSIAVLPPRLVAIADLAFLPALALYAGHVLWRSRNYRNLILVAVLALLFTGNLLMHLGILNGSAYWLRQGQGLGLNLITLLMAVIAGRITPAFSANWLRQQGHDPGSVKQSAVINALALGSIALVVPFDALLPTAPATGALLIAAAVLNGLRLLRWAPWRVAREPLLWILHLAYAWIVLALLLRGLAFFTPSIAPTLWQHALGVGAMGTLILGVMTRVCLGHTGRPLTLMPWGVLIYLFISLAALLRLFTAAYWLDYRWGILLAAISWVLAFALFLLLYWPILSQPRPDGRPG